MRTIRKLLAAVAAALLLTIGGAAAVSAAATPAAPAANGWQADIVTTATPAPSVSPSVDRGATEVSQSRATTASGRTPVGTSHPFAEPACPVVTVTNASAKIGGWSWRTTRTLCERAIGGYDCIQVDRVNAPDVVAVLPKTCIYTPAR